MTPVLSITGSDNTGASGIQADIRTITALGGHALTAVTTVTVQSSEGIHRLLDLPRDMVVGQVRAIVEESHPRAVKVGMVRDAATIAALKDEIVGCRQKVMVPGILTSQGTRLMDDRAMTAWQQLLIPEASLLLLRCNEAELLLQRHINTDDDMRQAARTLMDAGAEAVLIRGGQHVQGRLTALLTTTDSEAFFSSQNTEGWQRHGVAGALSSAIATRLAMGDTIAQAIAQAHDYMHGQIVYAVETGKVQNYRLGDLFNRFMALVAHHYRTAHDVAFYADRLAISTRYLCKVTDAVVGKSPKQVIAEYITKEAAILLETSRLTVSEIADMLGFSSLSMFSKFFSSYQGCSPMDYRHRAPEL